MKMGSIEEMRTKRGNLRYINELRQLAKQNRKNPTKAESLMWNMVLKNRKTGHVFLRQKPIGRFIVDFYCRKLLLVIEIDGSSHDIKENYDFGRDQYLRRLGIKTIRYKNDQVLNNLEEVRADLENKIRILASKIHP